MSVSLRKDILRAGSDDKDIAKEATHRVVKEIRNDVTQRYLMGTSQAVDIINGGVKGTPSLQCPTSISYFPPVPIVIQC
jgi:hypothetical protein